MSNNPSPLNFGSSQTQKSVETNEDGFAPFETSVSKVSEPVADRELLNSILIKDKKNVNPPSVIIKEEDVRNLGASSANVSAAVSERLLSAQRSGDSGEVGQLLSGIIQEAKGLSPEEMKKKGFVGKIVGLFGRAKDNFMGQYDTVQGRIDTMIREVDKHVVLHQKRVHDLEDLRVANYNFYLALKEDVKKGEQMLVHIQEMIDYARSQEMTDAFEANKVVEYEAMYNMLEKRLDDFRRVMIISQQTEPQLVLMKTNSHDLVDNFNTIKNTTIPVWRQMFAQYLIALDQQRGAALSKNIRDSTDEALRKNSEMFGRNAQAIAQERQRSVVSVERLEEMQRNLFDTLEKVAEIERKGRQDRQDAKPRLEALEKELVERFNKKSS